MGLADVLYFLRRPEFNKGLQDPIDITGIIISPGKEFTIRIRTSAAFTKLNI